MKKNIKNISATNSKEVSADTLKVSVADCFNMPIIISTEQKKNDQKVVQCKFCKEDIANKNFMRHLQRRHNDEGEVIEIFKNTPKGSKARRQAFAILRNDTNFDLYIRGVSRPNRNHIKKKEEGVTYHPCAYCKGIFTRQYLKRHVKKCSLRETDQKGARSNALTQSQTIVACAMDPTQVISKINVKKQVNINLLIF